MATQPQNFVNTTQLSSTASDVVSVIPAGTKAVVRKLSFKNTGSSTRTVTVYVIASGGTSGTTNILDDKAIPAGKTWNVLLIQGESIEAGMKVQADQDTGTDVNANCSGVLVT